MPLEIRELIIKATVGAQEGAEETASSSSEHSETEAGQENLVSLCVEKVLEILKDKLER